MQDPELAAAGLAGVKELGLAGVEIASNVGGVSLGDPRFADFLAEASRLGMPLFVRAMPAASERLPRAAAATFGVGVEGALAAAALITSGIVEAFIRRCGWRSARGGRVPADAAAGTVVLGADLERGACGFGRGRGFPD